VVKEIDSAASQSRLAAGDDVHLVDIRTQVEAAGGAILDAVFLPMHLIPLRMDELPKDLHFQGWCGCHDRWPIFACLFPGFGL
jgi:rhodanese-related sulfurtransferase